LGRRGFSICRRSQQKLPMDLHEVIRISASQPRTWPYVT
jgi:hypothetical protein